MKEIRRQYTVTLDTAIPVYRYCLSRKTSLVYFSYLSSVVSSFQLPRLPPYHAGLAAIWHKDAKFGGTTKDGREANVYGVGRSPRGGPESRGQICMQAILSVSYINYIQSVYLIFCCYWRKHHPDSPRPSLVAGPGTDSIPSLRSGILMSQCISAAISR